MFLIKEKSARWEKRNKEKYTPLTESEGFDQKHFSATQEEKNKFITEKFRLNENKNLSQNDKNRIIDIFCKNWQVLDITGYRMPEIKPSIMEPYHIKTFGVPKISLVRYINPQLSAQVKNSL